MYSIIRPTIDNPLFIEYRLLVNSEWGDNPNNDEFTNVPKPLLLIYNDKLVGGVTFARFNSSEYGTNTCWVNTLFIKLEYRGMKLATHLLDDAFNQVKMEGIPVLYVYTDKPEFYEKHGWQRLKDVGTYFTLQKHVN